MSYAHPSPHNTWCLYDGRNWMWTKWFVIANQKIKIPAESGAKSFNWNELGVYELAPHEAPLKIIKDVRCMCADNNDFMIYVNTACHFLALKRLQTLTTEQHRRVVTNVSCRMMVANILCVKFVELPSAMFRIYQKDIINDTRLSENEQNVENINDSASMWYTLKDIPA